MCCCDCGVCREHSNPCDQGCSPQCCFTFANSLTLNQLLRTIDNLFNRKISFKLMCTQCVLIDQWLCVRVLELESTYRRCWIYIWCVCWLYLSLGCWLNVSLVFGCKAQLLLTDAISFIIRDLFHGILLLCCSLLNARHYIYIPIKVTSESCYFYSILQKEIKEIWPSVCWSCHQLVLQIVYYRIKYTTYHSPMINYVYLGHLELLLKKDFIVDY